MLKLNVGLSKKIGLPDYGSRGAAVSLELDLESSLVGDPVKLKERIRQLFAMAKVSVDEELAAQSPAGNETKGGNSSGNGKSPCNGHANGDRRDGTRRATASQIRALVAIAERRKLDLEGLLAERFHTREAAELSIVEASSLIDELKGTASNGNGGRR
jgi:hypothetical protein